MARYADATRRTAAVVTRRPSCIDSQERRMYGQEAGGA